MTWDFYKQGELDYLCGVYSMVNALSYIGIGDPEKHFKKALSSLMERKRLHDGSTSGTRLKDLKEILGSCEDAEEKFEWLLPFERSRKVKSDNFWREFFEFCNGRQACGIIRVQKPRRHWMVIAPAGGNRVIVVDSDPEYGLVYIVNTEQIVLRDRKVKEDEFTIKPNQLILLRKP